MAQERVTKLITNSVASSIPIVKGSKNSQAASSTNFTFGVCIVIYTYHISRSSLLIWPPRPPPQKQLQKKSPFTRLWGCLSIRQSATGHAWQILLDRCHGSRCYQSFVPFSSVIFLFKSLHDSSSLSSIAPPSRKSTWRQLQLNIQPKWFL